LDKNKDLVRIFYLMSSTISGFKVQIKEFAESPELFEDLCRTVCLLMALNICLKKLMHVTFLDDGFSWGSASG
jgi:hypothetical protein